MIVRLLISGLVAFAPTIEKVDRQDTQFMTVGFPIAEGSDVHLAWLGYFAEDSTAGVCDDYALQKKECDGKITCWHLLHQAIVGFDGISYSEPEIKSCSEIKSPTDCRKSFCWFADLHAIDSKVDRMKGEKLPKTYQAYMKFPYTTKESCHIAGEFDQTTHHYLADEYRFVYPGIKNAHSQIMADLAYFEVGFEKKPIFLEIDNGDKSIIVSFSGDLVDIFIDHSPPPGASVAATHFKLIYNSAVDHATSLAIPSRKGASVDLGPIGSDFSCKSKFITEIMYCKKPAKYAIPPYIPSLTFLTPTSTVVPTSTIDFGPPVCPSARYPEPTQ